MKKLLTNEMKDIMAHKKHEPVIISADAGSGKTFTLLEKAKSLNDRELKSLILTFSNESADDLVRRCENDMNIISTFHSFLLECLNYNRDMKYQFISPVERKVLDQMIMSSILEKTDKYDLITSLLNGFISPTEQLLGIYYDISSRGILSPKKTLLIELEKINKGIHNIDLNSLDAETREFVEKEIKNETFSENEDMSVLKIICEILLEYDRILKERLRENNLLSFDMVEYIDLNYVKEYIEAKNIKALFVDEYQDVNSRQDRVVSYIESLESVEFSYKLGDEKQAIYKFRGCDNKFFKKRKESETTFFLKKNFRTSNELLKKFNNEFKSEGLDVKTYSDISLPIHYEQIKLFTGYGKLKYKISSCDGHTNTVLGEYKTMKARKFIVNDLFAEKVNEMLDSCENVAILVRKRSDLNFFSSALKELGISKKEANLIESNDFKLAYYILSAMLSELDPFIELNLKDLGLDRNKIKVNSEELRSIMSLEEFKEFIKAKLLKFVDFTDEVLEEILDIILFQNTIFSNQQKNMSNEARIRESLRFINLLFDMDLVIQSNPKNFGKIVVLTKHAAKGLEFDGVVEINGSNQTLHKPVIYTKYGIFSDLVVEYNGLLEKVPSYNYHIAKAIEKYEEKEQDLNLSYVAKTRAKTHYISFTI